MDSFEALQAMPTAFLNLNPDYHPALKCGATVYCHA